MGKFLLTCSVVILFILLQTEEIVSISKIGRSRSSSSSSSSSRKPSWRTRPFKPAEKPRKRTPNPSVYSGTPSHPVNPQNSGHFPHQTYKPQYNQWKHDLKFWKQLEQVGRAVIEDAVREALRGYIKGQAISNLHSHFNNLNEEQWWYEIRNRYSDRVYYPQYTTPVPRDVFVRDCVNITVKEYVEPTGNKTEDEMEATVVTHVVRKMCIKQYRTFSSSPGGGGSSRPHGGNPADPKPKGDEVKYVVGDPVVDAPVEDPESYILGSPIAKMYFNFNDSEEERWWNENRHRFATHVYHPSTSQPVSREAFLSECVNVTVGEYLKPTGNQTEDELEARVVTHLANEKCMEMYPRFTGLTVGGSYYNHKPETTLEFKREFKHAQGAAPGGASGHNLGNNAASDLNFSFENLLLLVHPFVISVLTLITPFLIF